MLGQWLLCGWQWVTHSEQTYKKANGSHLVQKWSFPVHRPAVCLSAPATHQMFSTCTTHRAEQCLGCCLSNTCCSTTPRRTSTSIRISRHVSSSQKTNLPRHLGCSARGTNERTNEHAQREDPQHQSETWPFGLEWRGHDPVKKICWTGIPRALGKSDL